MFHKNKKILILAIWLITLIFSAFACSAFAGGSNPAEALQPTEVMVELTPTPAEEENMEDMADTTPPVISDITSGTSAAYYGQNTCGPNSVMIYADVKDDAGILGSVMIRYRFVGGNADANGEFLEKDMSYVGGDRYTISLDINQEANAVLAGGEGSLEYQITAADGDENEATGPEDSFEAVPIMECTQAPSTEGDTSKPQIANTSENPIVVYYGGDCGFSTTILSATISDNSGALQETWVMYRYRDQSTGAVSDWIETSMELSGNIYSTEINIENEADQTMMGNNGALEYQIFAKDSSGNVDGDPDGTTHNINIFSCTAPQEETVQEDPAQAAAADQNVIVFNYISGSETVLYYGSCSTEPTMLSVQSSITPLEQASTVRLNYRYTNSYGSYAIGTNPMSLSENGEYAANIDVGNTAGNSLNGGSGELAYWVEAIDPQGIFWVSSTFTASVNNCQVGENNTPTVPNDQTSPATIHYFNGPGKASPGFPYTLSWDTSNANCGVYIDGISVNDSGSTKLNVPEESQIGSTIMVTLQAESGMDCSKPQIETAYSYIVVGNPRPLVSNWGTTSNYCCGVDLDSNYSSTDLLFSYHADNSFSLWSDNGTLLGAYPGSEEPNVADCFGVPTASQVTLAQPLNEHYYCFVTGNGNYGYFYLTYLVLDLNTGNPDEWKIEVIYFTESN